MTMHSKGPWRQSEMQPDAIVSDDRTTLPPGYKDPDDHLLYYGGYVVAESIAPQDRPLIAAAPDLLDALRGLLAIVSDSDGVAGYHRNGEVAAWDEFPEVAAALDAVFKATGQEVKA